MRMQSTLMGQLITRGILHRQSHDNRPNSASDVRDHVHCLRQNTVLMRRSVAEHRTKSTFRDQQLTSSLGSNHVSVGRAVRLARRHKSPLTVNLAIGSFWRSGVTRTVAIFPSSVAAAIVIDRFRHAFSPVDRTYCVSPRQTT